MGGWYGTAKYPGATRLPGVVVFRWEAPLFFASSGQFRDQVRGWHANGPGLDRSAVRGGH